MMKSEIRIRNSADVCYIDIEGNIGVPEEWQFDDLGARVATYERFRAAAARIAALEAAEVVVSIRSTGGDVNDALLIYDALRTLPGRITTRCYGYTASAATLIAQAASEGRREIAAGALYLIHNSECSVEGNVAELEARIGLLRKTDERLAEIYAVRSGRPAAEFAALMAENNGSGRWLSPEETVAAGLADRVIGAEAGNPSEGSAAGGEELYGFDGGEDAEAPDSPDGSDGSDGSDGPDGPDGPDGADGSGSDAAAGSAVAAAGGEAFGGGPRRSGLPEGLVRWVRQTLRSWRERLTTEHRTAAAKAAPQHSASQHPAPGGPAEQHPAPGGSAEPVLPEASAAAPASEAAPGTGGSAALFPSEAAPASEGTAAAPAPEGPVATPASAVPVSAAVQPSERIPQSMRRSVLALREAQLRVEPTRVRPVEDPSCRERLHTANERAYAEDARSFAKS